ncbi:CPBP family intramembrane metalloprotease [Burkholderia sp. FERM BP-3421]|jgi:membrane protease YdiL (CAAX protease family)|uniref:CPBP family intramembrane glutamic endopeptidase n=1 Tax=Burkholderia sp. FERM BP-3421 TaxID=1494466 RepID=UPI002360FFDC|nr:CPBP family intramembrane glutamic endopeptidase [Burkholderia sp. FERM BP-3421]WDD92946.1 CPBP family intramembrane metalloprotease [Burkholderia sp. FERM BP-3421]
MKAVKRTGSLNTSSFRLRTLWLGPRGLRAGWAALLYCALIAAIMAGFAWACRRLGHPFEFHGVMNAPTQIQFELALCIAALAATRAMAHLDRAPWLDFGLRAPRGAVQFTLGALCSVAIFSVLMLTLIALGGATTHHSGARAPVALVSGLQWAIAFVLVAAAEEIAFRGYVFFRLARGTHPVIATALTSFAFGLSHAANRGENLAGVVPVMIYGFVACLAIWRTGSLWWAIGLHATWDWSESFLFGAADSGLVAQGNLLTSQATGPVWLSGGTVGPEASVLVFPALAVLALIAWRGLPAAARQRPARAT